MSDDAPAVARVYAVLYVAFHAFRGQLSLGLSELAKETLVEKKIIILPNKSKKIITLLNPAVASASSFEEAEEMIGNNIPTAQVRAASPTPSLRPINGRPVFVAAKISEVKIPDPKPIFATKAFEPATPISQVTRVKWYLKPVFYYFIWPICGLALGAGLSFLIDYAFSTFFLHTK